ncbi:MAG: hypothetical protein ACK4GL_03145 [Flavobacteriales bacterium]
MLHRFITSRLVSIITFAVMTFCGLNLPSCKKTEEVLIDHNIPPPDPTLANEVRINFINKSYIALLGRKPNAQEVSAANAVIGTNETFTEENRAIVLNQILSNPEFYNQEFVIAKSELLNGIDTSEFTLNILVFQSFLNNTDFEPFWPSLQFEINRLIILRSAQSQFQNGAIGIREIHRRMVDNYFYDQINMGSLNFVIAVFQQFLFRNPTQSEAEQGVRMIDGFSSSLFLQVGESKNDFCNIFFNSLPYREGQVKILFNRFLFRLPTSQEMQHYTGLYSANDDYKSLIVEVLKTDEYAGIK